VRPTLNQATRTQTNSLLYVDATKLEGGIMNDEGQQKAPDEQQPETDSANNELGPTEKLREHDSSEAELSVPGAQNPASEEIKDEQNPNTE